MQPIIADPNQQQLAMAPGQMMPQMQMVQPGAGGKYNGDGFYILNNCQSIKVKQKFEMLEALTGYEQANEYKVYGDDGVKLFKCKEKSDWCARQCCPSGCRPYDYQIKMETGPYNDMEFLHAVREFACTCLCFNRPELTVFIPGTGQTLGYMTDPWACCDMTFDLFDADRNLVLKVNGSCCQCGLFCKCPCGPCDSVNFDIKDGQTGEVVGDIKNKFRAANLFAASDADNYEINFGKVQDPRWKAMVMVLAIFLDMRYFEQSGGEQRDNSALGQIMG